MSRTRGVCQLVEPATGNTTPDASRPAQYPAASASAPRRSRRRRGGGRGRGGSWCHRSQSLLRVPNGPKLLPTVTGQENGHVRELGRAKKYWHVCFAESRRTMRGGPVDCTTAMRAVTVTALDGSWNNGHRRERLPPTSPPRNAKIQTDTSTSSGHSAESAVATFASAETTYRPSPARK